MRQIGHLVQGFQRLRSDMGEGVETALDPGLLPPESSTEGSPCSLRPL